MPIHSILIRTRKYSDVINFRTGSPHEDYYNMEGREEWQRMIN